MKQQKIFNTLAFIMVSAALTACGGSGSSETSFELKNYIGKWGSCNGEGKMDLLLINPSTTEGRLLLEVETSFHVQADCSDTAGAYLIHSGASIVANKTGLVEVKLLSANNELNVQADQFTTNTTAGTVRVLSNGMTVTYSQLNNNAAESCVQKTSDVSFCFNIDDQKLIDGDTQIALFQPESVTSN